MRAKSSLPIYTRLGERELPVGWAWFRPEVQVGDTVRLPTAPGGDDGWKSFLVVGKRFRGTPVAEATTIGAIDLDVELLTRQD